MIGIRTLDGLINAELGTGICPCHNQEIGIRSGLDRNPNLIRHLGRIDHAATGCVAAFFRKFLIFDLDGCYACRLIALHAMANIEQAAIAGVGICNERRRASHCHLAGAENHVAE